MYLLLLANGCLAFIMNALQYMFVQRTSLIVMLLSSIVVKDTLVVLYGAAVLGESICLMQVVGFLVQILGAVAWAALPAVQEPPRSTSEVHHLVPTGRSMSVSSSSSAAGMAFALGLPAYGEFGGADAPFLRISRSTSELAPSATKSSSDVPVRSFSFPCASPQSTDSGSTDSPAASSDDEFHFDPL